MSRTKRHNRNGEVYLEKDSAGYGHHTNIKDSRGVNKYKDNTKLEGKYGKWILSYTGGYANERDSQSDRNKFRKHLEGKLLRRGIQRDAEKMINDELKDM